MNAEHAGYTRKDLVGLIIFKIGNEITAADAVKFMTDPFERTLQIDGKDAFEISAVFPL